MSIPFPTFVPCTVEDLHMCTDEEAELEKAELELQQKWSAIKLHLSHTLPLGKTSTATHEDEIAEDEVEEVEEESEGDMFE